MIIKLAARLTGSRNPKNKEQYLVDLVKAVEQSLKKIECTRWSIPKHVCAREDYLFESEY